MAYLFFNELGNKAYRNASGATQAGYGLTNSGPFTNFQNFLYWSGTVYAPSPGSAWDFDANLGGQGPGRKGNLTYALAVRPGDVAAVPEPDIYALMLLGFGVVGVMARRRRG